jgi:hypothetical protein
VIAALALTALMMQPPARDARPAPVVGTAAIAGVVVSADAQPRPLRRVRVTISGPTLSPGRTAITADDGTFTVTGLRAGRYLVAAAKDGYVAMTADLMRGGQPPARVTIADAETQKVTLRLPRGAVITGVILDADGQPAAGIAVTALARRFVGTQGERRYLTAGTTVSPSDDRGVYRIYGLPEGEYVVAAQPQNRQVGIPGLELRTVSRGAISDRGLVLSQVFHPGATEVGRATRVTVRHGEERSGIDVHLQYVPVATVSGIASAGSGWNPANLTMVRTDEVPGFEPTRSARADAEGRFTFYAVTPGQYKVLARSTAASPLTTSGSPLIVPPGNQVVGAVDVTIEGEDIGNLALTLQPALVISGRIVFEGERPGPELPQLRSFLPVSLTIGTAGIATPSLHVEGGRFKAEGIVPGVYRTVGALQGVRTPIGPWWLKSLVVNGRDLLDAPLDLRQSVDDAVVTFGDTAGELSGTARDTQGNAAADQVVVVASTDRSTWFFNSRRVVGVRSDAQGRYSIRNLPPGDYRIAAAADLGQGEWFDPAVLERLLPIAAAITITGVEKRTQDLVVR